MKARVTVDVYSKAELKRINQRAIEEVNCIENTKKKFGGLNAWAIESLREWKETVDYTTRFLDYDLEQYIIISKYGENFEVVRTLVQEVENRHYGHIA